MDSLSKPLRCEVLTRDLSVLLIRLDCFKTTLLARAIGKPQAAVAKAAADFQKPSWFGRSGERAEQQTIAEWVHVIASMLVAMRSVLLRNVCKAVR